MHDKHAPRSRRTDGAPTAHRRSAVISCPRWFYSYTQRHVVRTHEVITPDVQLVETYQHHSPKQLCCELPFVSGQNLHNLDLLIPLPSQIMHPSLITNTIHPPIHSDHPSIHPSLPLACNNGTAVPVPNARPAFRDPPRWIGRTAARDTTAPRAPLPLHLIPAPRVPTQTARTSPPHPSATLVPWVSGAEAAARTSRMGRARRVTTAHCLQRLPPTTPVPRGRSPARRRCILKASARTVHLGESLSL